MDTEIETYLATLKPIISKRLADGKTVTYFEIVITIVMLHFRACNVDIAVVEVGLGGRFDCTNVITPLVSVISKCDFDHKEVLGDTIEQIAWQKAGIIKPNIPAITSNTGAALDVIKKVAHEQNSNLTIINPDNCTASNFKLGQPMTVEIKNGGVEFAAAEIQSATKTSRTLPCGDAPYQTALCGRFQAVNTALAIHAIDILVELGMRIPDTAITDGLLNVRHRARFEILQTDPLVIFDGAHNRDSTKALGTLVDDYMVGVPVRFVVSVLSRKDLDDFMPSFISILKKGDDVIFAVQRDNEFHNHNIMMEKYIECGGRNLFNTTTMEKAIRETQKPILVVGSFKTYKHVVELLCGSTK